MNNYLIKLTLFFLFSLANIPLGFVQTSLSMQDVLDEVLKSSAAMKSAENDLEAANCAYDLFKANLKPFVSLGADLPQYSKTSSAIIQPDGSIAFQSIRQSNAALRANAFQVISATGGQLFATSTLQRFDDFSSSIKQYNGIPLRIGIRQPLFGYNPWKIQKQIQPLKVKATERNFNVLIEEANVQAASLYFNILTAKQDLEIANVNQQINEKLLVITEEKVKLGKVSKDEKLQLEIELDNAKLSVSRAKLDLKNAQNNLNTFLGQSLNVVQETYIVPLPESELNINMEALLDAFKTLSPQLINYQIAMLETEDELRQTKNDYGFQAELQASIGLARGDEKLATIYSDPFDEQQLNISLNVPILDWGRRRSALKQVELKKKALKINFDQQVLDIENALKERVQRLENMQVEVKLLEQILNKTEQRFEISNQRYVLGDIDITNLTLAQREKDFAKRNYITALRNYWISYYELRALSLYDISKNEKIKYK